MEDNSSIFADKAAQSETTTQTTETPVEQLSTSLVGEGKKYKSVDDLAKAYVSADSFIEQLKAENRELREKATAAKTVDDVLERLQQQQPKTPEDHGDVSVTAIQKLVEQTVTGLETRKTKESNLLKADKMMRDKYGDKAEEVFSRAATSTALKNILTELAAVDPSKFVAMFNEEVKSTSQVDISGGVNTTVSYSDATSVRIKQPGTKEYYDNIRKSDPSLYYSQEFQLGMDKAVRSNPNFYYGKK